MTGRDSGALAVNREAFEAENDGGRDAEVGGS
jgi:hypothetical protein